MAIKNMLGHTLDVLGESIVSGYYLPESVVPPETVLCKEFGVSRTVIREAVKSLVAKGLLSTGPKVGTRVMPEDQWNWFDPDVVAWKSKMGLTHEFLRDLQDLRRVIEPAAVRLAAERATEQDIKDLEAAYAGMKHAIEFGGDYISHDLLFHQGLLRACHNRMVAQMSKAIGALLRTSFEITTTRPNGTALSLPLHRAVLDAVIARSPDAAEKAVLVLMESVREDIEAVLDSTTQLPCVSQPAISLRAPNAQRAHPPRL